MKARPKLVQVLLIAVACAASVIPVRAESYTTNIFDGTSTDWGGSYSVGDTGSFNYLQVSSGGSLTDSRAFVGNALSASNNTALVTGSQSVWTTYCNGCVNNGYGFVHVGNQGSVNRLIVQNGGAVYANNGYYIGYDQQSTSNTVVVAGSNSVLSCMSFGNMYVGYAGSFNSLIATNGATVQSVMTYIGMNGSGANNSVFLSDVGSIWTNNGGDFAVGGSSDNKLTITNGAKVVTRAFYVGSSNNTVLITGQNSLLLCSWQVQVEGSRASIRVEDGGAIYDSSASVGYHLSGDNSNSVVISGNNSIWSNSGSLTIGETGRNQSLTVENGAQVTCADLYIGDSGSLTTLSVSNSQLSCKGLYIGSSGSSNSVFITGSNLSPTNVILGVTASSVGNLLQLASGSVTVTNAAANGTFDVRRGQLLMNGGELTVDSLLATGGNKSIVTQNGGTLNAKGANVANSFVYYVGDGASSATYRLLGGLHIFSNGLTISSNAVLRGCGSIKTLVGSVVNNGTIIEDCLGSSLVFSNDVVNNSSIVANGGTVEFFGSVVNYGVINGLNGYLNFHSAFINNGVLITSSSIPSIVSVVTTNAGIRIDFTTTTTAPYAVDYRDDLTSGSWSNLAENISGNGGIMSVIDSNAVGLAKRFYRARLVVP